jgi:hypothetical protein
VLLQPGKQRSLLERVRSFAFEHIKPSSAVVKSSSKQEHGLP